MLLSVVCLAAQEDHSMQLQIEPVANDHAIAEIQKVSKGNPREINAICDLCLLNSALAGDRRITVEHVADAARERM